MRMREKCWIGVLAVLLPLAFAQRSFAENLEGKAPVAEVGQLRALILSMVGSYADIKAIVHDILRERAVVEHRRSLSMERFEKIVEGLDDLEKGADRQLDPHWQLSRDQRGFVRGEFQVEFRRHLFGRLQLWQREIDALPRDVLQNVTASPKTGIYKRLLDRHQELQARVLTPELRNAFVRNELEVPRYQLSKSGIEVWKIRPGRSFDNHLVRRPLLRPAKK